MKPYRGSEILCFILPASEEYKERVANCKAPSIFPDHQISHLLRKQASTKKDSHI